MTLAYMVQPVEARVNSIALNTWIARGRPPSPDPSFMARRIAKLNLRSTFRQHEASRRTNLYNDLSEATDTVTFHKILGRQRKVPNSNAGSRLLSEDHLVSDPTAVRELWASYFENLGTPLANPSFDANHHRSVEVENSIIGMLLHREARTPLDPITPGEVLTATKKLNNRKAADLDGLAAEHIKLAAPLLAGPLSSIFTAIINIGYIPTSFRRGMVIPLLKKGKDPLTMTSYRGITVTSTVGKLFEHIILQRRLHVAKQHELQYSFTEGRSPNMASLLCTEAIAEATDNKVPVFMAALDSQKAFDVVDHQILKEKLFSQTPAPKLWQVEAELLDGLTATVRMDGAFSRDFPIRQGVGQGKVLSPHQYKTFINDLPIQLEEANVGAFIGHVFIGAPTCADDLLLIAFCKRHLQIQLDIAKGYADIQRYLIHPTKSQAITFNDKKKRPRPSLGIGRNKDCSY